ncbi:DUF2939 domain-containing protein [Moraxellaceae bacterium AER2_44_116]|nr:DUF2939 domain-containing protein [Moraxellaceae bacterium]TQC99803.1 DUF2939 domain-containing protein [Moraxellaceae bacterium AER2_44_116]
MKKIVALVLALIGGGFYATPYITLHNMQQAAQANDAAVLNQLIDYPAVKQSLKLSMNSEMSKALLKNKTDSGMNAFATMFASAFVNPMIDIIVTPENMAIMLQANMPKALDTNDKSTPNQSEQPLALDRTDVISHKFYQDFNHFVVTLAKADQPDLAFTFTFERNGLINWTLKGLAIPQLSK